MYKVLERLYTETPYKSFIGSNTMHALNKESKRVLRYFNNLSQISVFITFVLKDVFKENTLNQTKVFMIKI